MAIFESDKIMQNQSAGGLANLHHDSVTEEALVKRNKSFEKAAEVLGQPEGKHKRKISKS